MPPSRQIRKRDRARVQVVLHPAPLEPRLPDLPDGRVERGRPEDVRRARLPVRGPVEHVRPKVDIVHVLAWGEAEAEPRGFARAVVCSLSVGCGERTSSERMGTEEAYQDGGGALRVCVLDEAVPHRLEDGADGLERADDVGRPIVDCQAPFKISSFLEK